MYSLCRTAHNTENQRDVEHAITGLQSKSKKFCTNESLYACQGHGISYADDSFLFYNGTGKPSYTMQKAYDKQLSDNVRWFLEHTELDNRNKQLEDVLYEACVKDELTEAKQLLICITHNGDVRTLNGAIERAHMDQNCNAFNWLLTNVEEAVFCCVQRQRRLLCTLYECYKKFTKNRTRTYVDKCENIKNKPLLPVCRCNLRALKGRYDDTSSGGSSYANSATQSQVNLVDACGAGQLDVVKWLVEHTELSTEGEELKRALNAACQYGQLNVVKLLVEHTVLRDDIDVLSEALDIASRGQGRDDDRGQRIWQCSRWLIENTDLRNDSRKLSPALYMAGAKNRFDQVRWLVEHTSLRDDVRVLSNAIETACYNGHWRVVNWLLNNTQVDVNCIDNRGNSALHAVIWFGRNRGQTELHKACRTMKPDVDLAILRRQLYVIGENIDEQDNDGNTPLHVACEYGHHTVVEFLMLASADETITNDRGQTPAEVAFRRGRIRLLLLLNRSTLGFYKPIMILKPLRICALAISVGLLRRKSELSSL